MIEDVRLTGLNIAGASFEAAINPEGTETAYEFVIIGRQVHGSEPPERLSGPVQGGRIAAGTSAVAVSTLFSGLQPGYIYWLEVAATNLAGKTRSTPEDFFYDDPSAEGEQIPNPWPYRTEESGCANESGNLAAENTVKEQRAKEAAEAKTAEEAARKLREQERRRVNARPICVVPGLKGDTLRVARRRIAAAHCRLGAVMGPRDHGRLVVARQTPRRGSRLKDGARIALTLRPGPIT
jgi:hypothetical protein